MRKRLCDNDLLMPLLANIDRADGEKRVLTGLLSVDEKRMLKLSDENALALYRSGELAWL